MTGAQQVELTIEGLTGEGDGVGRHQGLAVFVPGALPGEHVLVAITQRKKNYAKGKLITLLFPSSQRVKPACPHFGQCGGCQLQHLSYEGQLAAKKLWVEDALTRLGGCSTGLTADVAGMNRPWRYRNRCNIHLSWRDGQAFAGFYSEKSRRLIPLADCLLLPPLFAPLAQQVASSCSRERLTGLHDLVIRQNDAGQLMLILLGEAPWQKLKQVSTAWQESFPALQSVYQNTGPLQRGHLWRTQWRQIFGPNVITEKICGRRLLFSPASFAQVNPSQTEVLYEKVRKLAGHDVEQGVWDIYCGVGAIGLTLVSKGFLWGVEENQEAIKMAKRNAALNHMPQATFIAGKAEDVLPRWRQIAPPPGVVVVDPPRCGCKPEVLAAICQSMPEKIIYVSCHPGTLARDVKILSSLGYKLQIAEPVDMFPHTGHVETVALFANRCYKRSC